MVVGEINLMLLFLRLQRRPTRATTAGAICRLGEREWIVFRSWSLLRVTRTTRSSARAFSLPSAIPQTLGLVLLSLGLGARRKPGHRQPAGQLAFWPSPSQVRALRTAVLSRILRNCSAACFARPHSCGVASGWTDVLSRSSKLVSYRREPTLALRDCLQLRVPSGLSMTQT